jgi:hypothetical protein
MCIIVTKPPKIAEEDIVAYKVLEIRRKFLCTPFQSMHIEFNRLYTNKYKEGYYRITSGVYHLFSSIEDAILLKEHAEKEYANDFNKSEFIVVKAIIPKGTKYYIGESEIGSELDRMFQHESYGTKSVIYKKLDA